MKQDGDVAAGAAGEEKQILDAMAVAHLTVASVEHDATMGAAGDYLPSFNARRRHGDQERAADGCQNRSHTMQDAVEAFAVSQCSIYLSRPDQRRV